MSAIGPGDFVECIFNGLGPWNRARPVIQTVERDLKVGAIYQVEVVWTDPADGGGLIRLRGIRADTTTGGFAVERFRPIYRPKAELIESLKAPPKRARKPSKQDVHA